MRGAVLVQLEMNPQEALMLWRHHRARRRSVASGEAASASARLPAGRDLALVAPSPQASAAPLASAPHASSALAPGEAR